MSKLSDYSKFDHLDSDSEDDDDDDQETEPLSATPPPRSCNSSAQQPHAQAPQQSTAILRQHPNYATRFIFDYLGQPVYEWEQSLQDVTVIVPLPANLSRNPRLGKLVQCQIQLHHLSLGLVNLPKPFLSEDTFHTVNVHESTWYIQDRDDDTDNNNNNNNHGDCSLKEIVICLTKANRSIVWDAALTGSESVAGVTLDAAQKEAVQQALMLERFGQEQPGMDFSGATFNGSVPDPRTFMGGSV